MTTAYEVPLTPEPQTFQIALVNVTYGMTVWWNVVNVSWMIDIYDASGNPILTGIPMVTGTDLLQQFAYLRFGFALIAQTDNAPDIVPTFADLGSTGHLYALTS